MPIQNNVHALQLNELKQPTALNTTLISQLMITSLHTITPKHIAMLWLLMTSAYGNNFTDQFGDRDSGMWFEALCDLNPSDLAYGLKKMIKQKNYKAWPPKPGEFLDLCLSRAKDFGLPSVSAAFSELQLNLQLSRDCWSHPAVVVAAVNMGGKILIEDVRRAYASFSKHYQLACRMVLDGNLLPVVDNTTLYTSANQAQHDYAQAQLAKFKKLLRG